MEVVNDNALEIAVGDVAHVDDIARFQVDMAMKSLGYDANGIKITDEITPISNTFTDASKEFQRLKIVLISKLEGYIVNQINC